MLDIGSVIDGKYKILSVIGKGGMSVVYLALNERANKSWAIKEVRKDGVQNYEVVRQNLIAETDMLKIKNIKAKGLKSAVIPITYYIGTSLEKAVEKLLSFKSSYIVK